MAKTQLPADLEEFVSKEVASLCDADPPVLAQYIIALIGTETLDDNLKSKLQENLKDFFEGQTDPFIERLFAKIKGQNDNAEQVSSNKERFNEFSDEEDDGDRNFKHRRQRSESQELKDRSSYKRRLDDDPRDSGNSSKYQRNDDRRNPNSSSSIPMAYDRGGRGGSRGMRGGGRGAGNMNRGQSRAQCRDYNERGFCMRGDLCPYDHGTDRIIVDESAGGGFPGAPFANNGPMAPMGGRGPQPFFGMPGVPDAYDPERAGLMAPTEMTGFLPGAGMLPGDMMGGMNNNIMRGNNGMHRGGRGGGRGLGRGRGGYQNRPYHNQNQNPLNTTLNVEKIPTEFCQISTVNDFFAKFGTITNISVVPHMQKAVIQYSTRAEAESAYSSPDAIFDNRFVKVYWAKEDTSGATGAGAGSGAGGVPDAAAPNVNEPDPELVKARAAELAKEKEEKQRKHQEHMKRVLEIQKKKESLLQQQIDEQKRLLAKLTDSAGMSKAEKSELLKALKSIQSDIDTSKSAAVEAEAALTSTTQHEEAVKDNVETAEDLKKKLARLEAEAAAIGVPGSGFRGGRGGYYGRGRGSWPRMRGGMTRMTLDNRPTKLFVKDIPQESTEPELRQHFEQFGNVTLFEQKDSGVVVQYGARFEAEKAMAAGPNYAKGTLQVAWSNEPTSSTTDTATTNEGA